MDRSLSRNTSVEEKRTTLNSTDQKDLFSRQTSEILDQPRKRSRSVIHWMQKHLVHKQDSHNQNNEQMTGRQRSSTITAPDQVTLTMPEKDTSHNEADHRRKRSSTMVSTTSHGKTILTPKKIISDTDEAAHQSPSLFQFVLIR